MKIGWHFPLLSLGLLNVPGRAAETDKDRDRSEFRIPCLIRNTTSFGSRKVHITLKAFLRVASKINIVLYFHLPLP